MLEGYSVLNFLTPLTERVQLGTLVTGVIYRYPAILIETAQHSTCSRRAALTSVLVPDGTSVRRAALGVPFPPLKERFEQLEETLQIAKQMWSGKVAAYEGILQFAETLCEPQPVTKPHPPIMIGGSGEKKTLRLVAKYGDACNLYAFDDPDVIRKKLEVLRRHCDELGRNYDDIERTAIAAFDLRSGAMLSAKCNRVLPEAGGCWNSALDCFFCRC